MITKSKTVIVFAAALAASTSVTFAGGSHGGGHGESAGIGKPGTQENASRTVEVSMTEMKYSPSKIEVKQGETITFVVSNDGRMVHEFNLGTHDMWNGHSHEMRSMMQKGMMTTRKLFHDKMKSAGMMHDDPNSVLLEPGETAEITWTFSEDSEMGFACNVPGHREAGMVGEVRFGGG
ncbi:MULTISPECIES: cupredoxin domain-containing protein [Roseovarius]|uniref:cupredoxin domain-containing protein n=1 Tax=Roseovarius TaxID=74030 RepID=UPI001C0BD76E|nr:plastocyanin/azurin family copper-binding protein [Roseovarius sp. PS-C2]MBU3259545.1 cupredoxin domain-containing protein [Roseovarius sp. PS-C2]